MGRLVQGTAQTLCKTCCRYPLLSLLHSPQNDECTVARTSVSKPTYKEQGGKRQDAWHEQRLLFKLKFLCYFLHVLFCCCWEWEVHNSQRPPHSVSLFTLPCFFRSFDRTRSVKYVWSWPCVKGLRNYSLYPWPHRLYNASGLNHMALQTKWIFWLTCKTAEIKKVTCPIFLPVLPWKDAPFWRKATLSPRLRSPW